MTNQRAKLHGFTLLELLVVIGIIAVVVGLIIPAVQRVRDAAARIHCANNLRQIGLALHGYHDTRKVLPPGTRGPSDRYPFMAWSARILPYLEQVPLWDQTDAAFAHQPSFGFPQPHPGLSTVLPVYLCPADGRSNEVVGSNNMAVAFTFYLGVSGSGRGSDGVLYYDSKVRLADVRDGTSNTLMVGERPPSPIKWFGWWYAGVGQDFDGSADYLMSVAETNRTPRLPTCPRGPYTFGPGSVDEPCDTLHFWSRHIGGAHFLFCDGSTRFLHYSAAPIMPALASRAGGETVSAPD